MNAIFDGSVSRFGFRYKPTDTLIVNFDVNETTAAAVRLICEMFQAQAPRDYRDHRIKNCLNIQFVFNDSPSTFPAESRTTHEH